MTKNAHTPGPFTFYTPDLLAERDRLRAVNAELVRVLQLADGLRPMLLAQAGGYVPEPVLHFCNQARAALAKARREGA